MTHKSHVKFISFNATMLNGSLCRRRRRRTALIDQRAVAAGKKWTSLQGGAAGFVPERICTAAAAATWMDGSGFVNPCVAPPRDEIPAGDIIFSDAAGIFEEDDTCINKCAAAADAADAAAAAFLSIPLCAAQYFHVRWVLLLFGVGDAVTRRSGGGAAALRSLFPVRSVRQGEGLQLPSERASWERLVESELWKCIIGGREGGKGGEGKHNKKALHIRGKCRKRGTREGLRNAAFIPKNGTRNVKCRAAAAARFLLSPP